MPVFGADPGLETEVGAVLGPFWLRLGAGWPTICKGGRVLLDDFDKPEVFVDGERIPPFKDPKEIVEVTLPASEKVVNTTDYETFNKEIAPFVDSMELMMF